MTKKNWRRWAFPFNSCVQSLDNHTTLLKGVSPQKESLPRFHVHSLLRTRFKVIRSAQEAIHVAYSPRGSRNSYGFSGWNGLLAGANNRPHDSLLSKETKRTLSIGGILSLFPPIPFSSVVPIPPLSSGRGEWRREQRPNSSDYSALAPPTSRHIRHNRRKSSFP